MFYSYRKNTHTTPISHIIMTIMLIVFGLSLVSSGTEEVSNDKEKSVIVSIAPLKYIVESIAGTSVTVYSLVNSTESPEAYNVSAKELFLLENTDIYFSLGDATTYPFFNFEQVIQTTLQQKNSPVTIVPLASEVALVPFYDTVIPTSEDEHEEDEHEHDESEHEEDEHGHDESEHEEDEHEHDESEHEGHEHGAYDIHVWLDTDILKTIAHTVYVTLSQHYPVNTEMYEKNYDAFLKKVEAVEEKLAALDILRQQKILIMHPSLGYLAKKFDFTQVSLEWLGKERGMRDIIAIENIIAKNNISVLFTQSTMNIDNFQRLIQKFNLRTIEIQPLKEDVFQNLLDISSALQMSVNK